MTDCTYQITQARYSKGNMLVRCPSLNGYDTRASRLIKHYLNCRYTGREHGFVASPAKVKKFIALFEGGYDADRLFYRGQERKLVPPRVTDGARL